MAALVVLIAPPAHAQVALPCGEAINANIGGALERDFYALGASAGDVVSIRLHVAFSRPNVSNAAGLLELFDPAGQRVGMQAGTAGVPTVEATLATSGVYTVVVSANDREATGTYSLIYQRLNAPCASLPLTCGQVTATTISARVEVDAFRFDAVAGNNISLRLFSSLSSPSISSLAANIELLGPAGERVATRSGTSAALEVRLTANGTYSVLVSASDRLGTGSYSVVFQRLDDPCSAAPLACGQNGSSSIAAQVEVDAYRLVADAGALSFRATSALRAPNVSSVALLLELYDATGRLVSSRTGVTFLWDVTLPASGAYTLLVSASDRRATGTYTVLWEFPTRPCQSSTFTFLVSPMTLNFSTRAGVPGTAPLQLSLGSNLPGLPWQAVTRTTDGGDWLRITPSSGHVPATAQVSVDATRLSAGTYRGAIDLTAPGGTPSSASVAVSLTVTAAAAAALSVDPNQIAFNIVSGDAAPTQLLRIGNTGAGSLAWAAQAATVTGGWLAVSPASGSASAGTPATVQVSVNPAGLAVGSYLGSILVRTESGSTVAVPVSLVVSPPEGSLLISQSGLLFRAVEAGGAEPPQEFGVLNIGSGSLDWSAQVVLPQGQSWLRATPASGRSDAASTQVPLVTVSVDPTGLAAGFYVGAIRVTAAGANNSPQTLRVDLHVLPRGTRLGAVVRPTGLIFVRPAGATSPESQEVTVATTEPDAVPFISQTIGGDWVTRTPDVSTSTRATPGRITVRAASGQLAAGVYRAGLTVMTQNDGELHPVNLLLAVVPGATTLTGAGSAVTADCGSSQLLLQFSSVFSSFNAIVGWPTVVRVRAADNCGTAAAGGSIVLTFSTGDPPLLLTDLRNGEYIGSWLPNATSALAIVTAQASWRGLQAQLTATARVTPNPNAAAAVLYQGGVVLGAGFERGPVAPGSIISLFGERLTSAATQASSLPLPRTLGGLRVRIGDRDAPLFYAGPGQVNAQVPFETAAGRQLQIAVESNGIPSAPQNIQSAATRPGIFTLGGRFGNQGAILIANTNRLAMPVEPGIPSEPAAIGAHVSIFATGLGLTDASVASGEAPPAGLLANVTVPVTVTIGGQPATVSFAGLAPGFAGVYQINAQVPAGIAPGPAVPVVLTQGGITSNTATIAVR